MLISFKQVQDALRVYTDKTQARRAEITAKPGRAMDADKVTLSAEGKEIQTIRQAVAQAPEVREAKVAELQAAIKSGTYNVSGDEIAEKMLSRGIVDGLF